VDTSSSSRGSDSSMTQPPAVGDSTKNSQ
jgi:hypothetical protein